MLATEKAAEIVRHAKALARVVEYASTAIQSDGFSADPEEVTSAAGLREIADDLQFRHGMMTSLLSGLQADAARFHESMGIQS
jgi:hypothetical protein